jgi:hypothetical protein
LKLQNKQNKKQKMKQVINSIVFAIISATASLQAGEPSDSALIINTQLAPQSLWSAQVFGQGLFQDDTETFGAGISLRTQVTRETFVEVTAVASEDQVYSLGANGIYFLTDNFLYLIGGTSYNFDEKSWNLNAGAGVSYPLYQQVRVFADVSYTFSVSDSDKDGGCLVRSGLSFKF